MRDGLTVLRRAKRILEREGWSEQDGAGYYAVIRPQTKERPSSFTLLGAIRQAAKDLNAPYREYELACCYVIEAIEKREPGSLIGVGHPEPEIDAFAGRVLSTFMVADNRRAEIIDTLTTAERILGGLEASRSL